MLVGGLGMTMSPRRFLATLGVFAFAVVFRRGPVAFGRCFVVFCCFGMGFPRHPIFLRKFQLPENALTHAVVPCWAIVVLAALSP
jgi:hypothetical protein